MIINNAPRTTRTDGPRPDDAPRERADDDDGPSFELDLAAESHRPRGGRELAEREASREDANAPLTAHDPRAAVLHEAAPVDGGGVAPTGGGYSSGLPRGLAASVTTAATPAAQPTVPAPEATLMSDETVALSAAARALPQETPPPVPLVAPDAAALDLEPDEPAEDDGAGAASDDLLRLELRPPDAAPPSRSGQNVTLDGARPLAEQLADAVQRLAAESADRSELVRFRSAEVTFAALMRHDANVSHVRLLSDDPNTRAFLGDRLPDVRQALERVGFASTGLSVAADGGSHRRRDREPPPEASEPAPDDDAPPRRVDLIL